MKKDKSNIILIALVTLLVFASSCHTTPLHFVKKRISGEWVRTPLEDPEEQGSRQVWQFYEEQYLSLVSTEIDSEVTYTSSDPYYLFPDTVDYKILRTIRGHQLYLQMSQPEIFRTQQPPTISDVDNNDSTRSDSAILDSLMEIYETEQKAKIYVQKYDIIHLSKRRMYLSGRQQCAECGKGGADPDMTGGRQMGFIRQGR